MSRIDDSDNQRIQEMNEAELRNRLDREKRDQEKLVTRSFNQVMQEKSRQHVTVKAGVKHEEKTAAEHERHAKPASPAHTPKAPRNAAELARRAALSSAMHSSLARQRATDAESARAAQIERAEDLARSGDDEKERIDRDSRAADDRDLRRTEERETDHRKVDPDGEGRPEQDEPSEKGSQGGREGSGEDRRTEAVEPKDAARPGHEPRISAEVIDRIVNAIYAAHHADGRTEMQIELKGTMLEGIRLKVTARRGKVHCLFEGCSREMKALLESSKGALMRSLSKKGLTLTSLRAV